MILTNFRNEKIELTEKETEVINWINTEIEEGRELVFACDIEYGTGMSNRIARGVVASLVKKGLIDVNVKDGGLISRFY